VAEVAVEAAVAAAEAVVVTEVDAVEVAVEDAAEDAEHLQREQHQRSSLLSTDSRVFSCQRAQRVIQFAL